MLDFAKREIDLAGFLAMYGWQWAEDQNPSDSPVLVSPDGTRIVVTRSADDDHWIWCYEDQRKGGSIVDAMQQLLGEQNWVRLLIALRNALNNPPYPLPPPAGWQDQATLEHGEISAETTYELYDLSEHGWQHLVDLHVDPLTIDRFAHTLREDAAGSVVAVHDDTRDGWGCEVSSSQQGAAESWLGHDPTLWLALPADGTIPTHLLVAASFLDALRAHSQLPEHLQAQTGLAATGGEILSVDGVVRLEKMLTEMRCQYPDYDDLTLVDVRDNQQGDEADERAGLIHNLAEAGGINYFYFQLIPVEMPGKTRGRSR